MVGSVNIYSMDLVVPLCITHVGFVNRISLGGRCRGRRTTALETQSRVTQ